MAYFLEPLIKLVHQILHPEEHQRWILDHNKAPQMESLLQKAVFMRDYIEDSAPISEESLDSLEDKIRDAVQSAEDIIESHIADQFSASQIFTISPPDLQRVVEDFDSAKEEMMKIMDEVHRPENALTVVAASRSDPNHKNIFVGFTEDLAQLKDRVTEWSSKLEVIPIVGMGGIGKTTLARKVYDDPSVASCFDVLAWTTISQDYSTRAIFLGLLRCIIEKQRMDEEMFQKKDNELGITLHQQLMGKKYLIVLDDMWHSKAWDAVKKFFPNGGRIMLTTRESHVATYVDPKSSHHQMHLLNEHDSWELLRKKVYGDEPCPPEYEKVGIKIANSCRGLPFAIQVIGGLLSHATRTKESWAQVAYDVSSTAADKDEQFSKILSLSYNHLPQHVKPCFLYMAAFPEDYEIPASKLIWLWVAEGFLKPIEHKSLEDAAEVYLKALVDRNLIFVRKQEINGEIKSYGVHDLLRDLCVSKARRKKFLYVKNRIIQNTLEDTLCERRVSVHTSYRIREMYSSVEQMSCARTFLCIGPASKVILSPFFLALRLLRELDVLEIEFLKFPEEVLQLDNLKYLAFTCAFKIPKRISGLRNLQTLVVRLSKYCKITTRIFQMPQLRHVKFTGIPGWCIIDVSKNHTLHENLQSLFTIEVSGFELVLPTVPNLTKLGIHNGGSFSSEIRDLACLQKLKTLKFSTNLSSIRTNPYLSSSSTNPFSSNLILPPSLKKICLRNCTLKPTFMNIIGMLPNLEILKLQNSIFENLNWEPSEGEFSKLQLLQLQNLNLVTLTADQNNFPRLRHLIIRHCTAFEEISTDLGEIPTLEIIEVDESSANVAETARKILEEQREYGNELLQVRISAM